MLVNGRQKCVLRRAKFLACERAAKMCAAEHKVPSFAEVHIPATDGSTFLQLKMAGAGIPGAKCEI